MSVQLFDDFDDMLRAMQRDQQEADARVHDWQRAVKPGDAFIRDAGVGIPVYGQVLPEEEKRPQGLENYRFCKCYSAYCPAGELGDVHVSTLVKILSDEEFNQAKRSGWR